MNSVIGLPLRVGSDGRLVRSEPVDALLELFRAMAWTPSGALPHAPWFGLHEAFAEANPGLEDQSGLTDAFNAALVGLGVEWTRVERVHTRPGAAFGERSFDVVLVDTTTGRATHAVLQV